MTNSSLRASGSRAARADQRLRAEKIFQSEIEFIDSDEFESMFAAKTSLKGFEAVAPRRSRGGRTLGDGKLLACLAPALNEPLLSFAEEQHEFRRMNYLKYVAARLRSTLDRKRPSSRKLEEIEHSLAEAIQVREHIIPAYQRVRALMAEELPSATDDAGVWRLPRGADYYASNLASLTTTKLTPAEIHAIGLREVTRVEAEMEKLLQQLGYKDGTIQERIEKLNATLNPPAEPDPRVEMVAKVEALVHDAEKRSVAVFDLRPKAPVTVKREPAFSEKSAAAHYSPPAPDGTKPGIYWLPLADLGPRVTWLGTGLKSTAYHEAVPGHHFQLSIQQESTELPRYRKLGVVGFNSAYLEGWALYAERLASENGWYEGDVPGQLGFLNLQLFRARRLVADTGLHNLKWTRQQVVDYGFTPQETERYIVWPGQACSYMIGQLRILELREKARAALGAKFSIKEFHNLVLRGGSMPLDVLAQEVDNWIAAGGR